MPSNSLLREYIGELIVKAFAISAPMLKVKGTIEHLLIEEFLTRLLSAARIILHLMSRLHLDLCKVNSL